MGLMDDLRAALGVKADAPEPSKEPPKEPTLQEKLAALPEAERVELAALLAPAETAAPAPTLVDQIKALGEGERAELAKAIAPTAKAAPPAPVVKDPEQKAAAGRFAGELSDDDVTAYLAMGPAEREQHKAAFQAAMEQTTFPIKSLVNPGK